MLVSVQEVDDRLRVMQTSFQLHQDASSERKASPTGQHRSSPGLDGVVAERSEEVQPEVFSVESYVSVRLYHFLTVYP